MLRPFYTMPLLPGKNLRQLLDEKAARLTIERSIEILRSACRGLQAAHDNGLIHRDLKPANIFVMPDDSVKLIDFGIAHAAESGKQTMLKGTLQYMAPELLDMKQPTAMSDIYSIAVVAYETLGGRLPFPGLSAHELADAIRERTPPPLVEVNSRIPRGVSQTVHKAMAKQPWHRFSRAQELGDMLVRALAGEAIQLYDPEQVRQRLERAQAAFEEGDPDFAAEVVRDLEGEGVQNEQVTLLRKRVEQAMRHGRVQKLLASARRFRDAGEAPVALKKLSEALDLDPQDADALALRAEIERERRAEKRDGWLRVAREHMANGAFDRAQEGVSRALELKPDDMEALELRTEISRAEREAQRARQRKEEIYQTALEAWNRGDVSHALTRMESLMALQQARPDADPDRAGAYQKLFQEVRSEHEGIEAAHEQARRALAEDRLEEAGETCRKFLSKYPANALFQSLQFDIEERGRLKLSQTIADTDRRVEREPDLERKIAILTEALESHPGEAHFERALALAREKNDLVQGIVRKARYLEEQGQAPEALSQWRMLRSIYPPYPALELEIERLEKRGEQLSANAEKAERIAEIKALLSEDAVEEALRLCQLAWTDSPDDAEVEQLHAAAARRRETLAQVRGLVERAEQAGRAGDHSQRLELLREARRLDEDSGLVKASLVAALVERARALADSDWNAAAPLVDEPIAPSRSIRAGRAAAEAGGAQARPVRRSVPDARPRGSNGRAPRMRPSACSQGPDALPGRRPAQREAGGADAAGARSRADRHGSPDPARPANRPLPRRRIRAWQAARQVGSARGASGDSAAGSAGDHAGHNGARRSAGGDPAAAAPARAGQGAAAAEAAGRRQVSQRSAGHGSARGLGADRRRDRRLPGGVGRLHVLAVGRAPRNRGRRPRAGPHHGDSVDGRALRRRRSLRRGRLRGRAQLRLTPRHRAAGRLRARLPDLRRLVSG